MPADKRSNEAENNITICQGRRVRRNNFIFSISSFSLVLRKLSVNDSLMFEISIDILHPMHGGGA